MRTLFPGVALVTGAAGGIGGRIAASFAQEGCTRIAITDREVAGLVDTEKLILAAHELYVNSDKSHEPVEIKSITVDIKDEKGIEELIKTVAATFGRVDYAVNCAGDIGVIGPNSRSTETSAEAFDDANSINYRGCWLCSRAEIAQMLKQEPLPSHDGRPGVRGSVVNIASSLGLVSKARGAAYCASKAAIISLTKTDAIDYSAENIRVNCVCPGVIATPMTTSSKELEEALKPAIATAPMNRMGTPQEFADAVLFLSSSKASFIQGSSLVIDGGYSIN